MYLYVFIVFGPWDGWGRNGRMWGRLRRHREPVKLARVRIKDSSTRLQSPALKFRRETRLNPSFFSQLFFMIEWSWIRDCFVSSRFWHWMNLAHLWLRTIGVPDNSSFRRFEDKKSSKTFTINLKRKHPQQKRLSCRVGSDLICSHSRKAKGCFNLFPILKKKPFAKFWKFERCLSVSVHMKAVASRMRWRSHLRISPPLP